MATDIEYDFVTSLLVDPVQLPEVGDINVGMLEDEHCATLLDLIRQREGKVTPAIVHKDLQKTPRGKALLQELATAWSYGQDTRSVVDQFFRDGLAAGSASTLADRIREEFLVRHVEQVAGSIKRDQFLSASDWAMTVANKINEGIARVGGGANLESLQEGVDEALQLWEFRLDNPERVTGQRVGLGYYDVLVGGFKPGELIMIGGHSGEGKSQAMIHMCLNAAQTPNDMTGLPARVAYFSLEMNQRQMSERFIAHLGKVDISSRLATPEDRKRARKAGELIKQMNQDGALTVVDPSSIFSLDQICRELIRQKQVNGLTMAFIDYAQLISVGGKDSKYNEIADISKRLKAMALQLDIPIVTGVQLNREAMKETRAARPKLYHIADGMDLVRSADLLQMIWTPGRHLGATEIGPWKGIAVLLTEKRRSGMAPGPFYFKAEYQYSLLRPVSDAVAQELNSPDAQACLNKPRTQQSNKYNGATP